MHLLLFYVISHTYPLIIAIRAIHFYVATADLLRQRRELTSKAHCPVLRLESGRNEPDMTLIVLILKAMKSFLTGL